MSKLSYDYLFKIIIIGDSYVGKSCLLRRYTDCMYNDDNCTTIGIEFGEQYSKCDKSIIKLQLWDTAGQEAYYSICKSYYRDAAGIILCFDLTNRSSFFNIKKWLSDIRKECLYPNRILLVGTKCDLSNIQITHDEIMTFVKKEDLTYIKVSSKKDINVQECFTKLTNIIYEDFILNKKNDIPEHKGIKVNTANTIKPTKCFICL